jgi:hypothetical protein
MGSLKGRLGGIRRIKREIGGAGRPRYVGVA